jgi:hypothetical protein
MDRIQLELFYDYQTNVVSYPKWQAYLREHQPRTLVVWANTIHHLQSLGHSLTAKSCRAPRSIS